MALPPITVRRRRSSPSLSSFVAGFRPRSTSNSNSISNSISSSNNKNGSEYDCHSKVDDVNDDIVEVASIPYTFI